MKDVVLLKNAYIVTMDTSLGIIENGHIVIEGNRIKFVGKHLEEALKTWKPEIVFDLKGKVIVPGLINLHSHMYQIMLKGVMSDLPYAIWDNMYVFPLAKYMDKEATKYAGYLAMIEMLESGTTTVADIHYFHTNWNNIYGLVEAAKEIGIRGCFAWGIIDEGAPEYIIRDSDESLRRFSDFYKKWNNAANKRIRVDIAPVGFGMTSEETIKKIAVIARELGLWIHIHAAGTQAAVSSIMWKKMMTEIEYFEQLGILGSKTIAAHAVWVNKSDIKLLSKRGVHIAHNPVSNMYLAFGVAPIPYMLEHDINVGLGTDGLGSYSQDMFFVMRTALLMHKLCHYDTYAINAETVLKMATINAAKALGLQNKIGTLSPNKRADLVIIDLKHANTTPYLNIHPILVHTITPKNIDMVFVNGEIVVEDGKVTMVDRDKIIEESKEIAKTIWDRCGFI